jgi:hypothetical protein
MSYDHWKTTNPQDNEPGNAPQSGDRAESPENPFAQRAAQTEAVNHEAQKKALIPVGPKGVELRDVDAMFRFARCYLQSRLAPPAYRTEQQLVIVWATAAELGLSPMQAVSGMTIINNKVGIMGDLALAMVEGSGLLTQKSVSYEGEGDELVCKVSLRRKKRQAETYSFSVAEAKQAGIYERSSVWKSYPKRMCYYRALGFGLRDEFSDVLKGIKTVEELQDYPENHNGK